MVLEKGYLCNCMLGDVLCERKCIIEYYGPVCFLPEYKICNILENVCLVYSFLNELSFSSIHLTSPILFGPSGPLGRSASPSARSVRCYMSDLIPAVQPQYASFIFNS